MALAIADQIRFRFRFRFRFRMRMDLAAYFCRCWRGLRWVLSRDISFPRTWPRKSRTFRLQTGCAIARQCRGHWTRYRFGNQHWKATGNSPSPTSGFADLNKAKSGDYQTGQVKVNGSDTTGSTQFGMPLQGGESTSVPNSPAASNFKQQPSSTTYTAQRPATSGYNSGSYKQSGSPKSTYTSPGRSTSRK